MPQSPASPARDPASPAPAITIVEPICAVFRRQLKRVGQKYTPERARILDAVVAMHGPFQADQIIATLRTSASRAAAMASSAASPAVRVSKATVYRTLKLLQDAGVIQQVLLGAEQAHYQLAFGTRATGLLVRSDTNEIIEFDAPELAEIQRRVCESKGLKTEGLRLVVYASARR